MALPKISVIIPVDRPGPDADRAIASVLDQPRELLSELIVVASSPDIPLQRRAEVRLLVDPDRNPARRRNRAAAEATGEVLGFIDDDAIAEGDWLRNASAHFATSPETIVLGGPDPAPDDSSTAELVSETLLTTPLIGSGVLAHENRPGVRRIRTPHAIALVNLFVRRPVFDELGGFDEETGYIGEDTALVAAALEKGEVVYRSDVVVRHRRRPFPAAYLRQRWNYRVKTGRLLAEGSPHYSRLSVALLLGSGTAFAGSLLFAPAVALRLLALYAFLVTMLAAPVTRLGWWWWPLFPLVFLLHHATYFTGVVVGLASGLVSRAGKRK